MVGSFRSLRYSSPMKRRAGTGAVLVASSAVGALLLDGAVSLQGGVQATGSITGIVTMDNPPASSTLDVDEEPFGRSVQGQVNQVRRGR